MGFWTRKRCGVLLTEPDFFFNPMTNLMMEMMMMMIHIYTYIREEKHGRNGRQGGKEEGGEDLLHLVLSGFTAQYNAHDLLPPCMY